MEIFSAGVVALPDHMPGSLIEEQPDANLYHHMSITRRSGKVPNPYLVTDLLPLFDMGKDLNEMDNIWVNGPVVNLIKIWKKFEDREVKE